MDAAFEFFTKLGVPFYCFHDRDIAPEGGSFKESAALLDEMADRAAEHQERTGVQLLWGTANLFSNPRYQAGAATNPDPEVFAYAAAQVAHCLEVTHRLGGHNYVLWGGREGYDTLLNTDLRRELDQLARFLSMVVEHKHRIGFAGTILIEPKPFEPTKHQYDYDVAAVHAFLQRYDLADEIKVNIEVNHATLSGHDFAHEIAVAVNAGIFGSIDANAGDDRLGWDVDRFPVSVEQMALGMLEILRGRRVHHRRAELRRQAAPPVDRPRPTCSTATSAGWTRWPGRCWWPTPSAASSTPTATPATPAGTASSAGRSSTATTDLADAARAGLRPRRAGARVGRPGAPGEPRRPPRRPRPLMPRSSPASTRPPARRRSRCATSTAGGSSGAASAPHPPTQPPRSEQDPAAWWAAFESAWRQAGEPAVDGDQRRRAAARDGRARRARTRSSGRPSCGTTPSRRRTRPG